MPGPQDSNPERAKTDMATLQALRAGAFAIYGLVSPREVVMQIGFEGSICFIDVPAWNQLVQAEPADKPAMTGHPAWREQARHEADTRPA